MDHKILHIDIEEKFLYIESLVSRRKSDESRMAQID